VLKYYFKLQPLLNKEKFIEDECARALKALHDASQAETEKIEKHIELEIKYQDELATKKQKQISPSEFKVYEDYFVRVNDEIDAGRNTIKEIAKKLKIAQDKLSKIVKKRKALEKLKERGHEEYKSELFSALTKEMDDIAISKFFREKKSDDE
jgi:flagellar FliJ protein